MIEAYVTRIIGTSSSTLKVEFDLWENDVKVENYFIEVDKTIIHSVEELRPKLFAPIDEYIFDLRSYHVNVVKFMTDPMKNMFKASVSGGSGNVIFYTDMNGDGTGPALYPNLTADNLSLFVDGVSDQYAFPTISVDSSKKFVTVNVKKLIFTSGNALTTLLGGLSSFLTGNSYTNAANGIAVKMIIGNAY